MNAGIDHTINIDAVVAEAFDQPAVEVEILLLSVLDAHHGPLDAKLLKNCRSSSLASAFVWMAIWMPSVLE